MYVTFFCTWATALILIAFKTKKYTNLGLVLGRSPLLPHRSAHSLHRRMTHAAVILFEWKPLWCSICHCRRDSYHLLNSPLLGRSCHKISQVCFLYEHSAVNDNPACLQQVFIQSHHRWARTTHPVRMFQPGSRCNTKSFSRRREGRPQVGQQLCRDERWYS